MIFIDIVVVLSYVYSVFYSILIIKHINKLQESVENFYSNSNGKLLKWAKYVVLFLLTYLFFLVVVVPDDSFFSYAISSSVNVFFIFWVGIAGMKQTVLFESLHHSKELTFPKVENQVVNPKNDNDRKNYDELLALMEKERIFLHPNISLVDVARRLSLSPRYLSELIRKESEKNFSQFINYYRVEEAKKLLVDSSKQHLSMLGVAYDSGFNSKASFYSVFKKFTAQTPTQFKNTQLSTVLEV